MLDQIIYTECNPQRDLLHEGKIVHKSGYGIFSMSKEIFTDENNKNLRNLYEIFTFSNCTKEKDEAIGTFGSYIYTETLSGMRIFMFDYGRPHCKNPLKERLHRSGIHIKQCFVGQPKDYPYKWFGTSVWNAWKRHEDEYFLDDVPGYEPPFLPCISDNPPEDSGVDVNEIRQFVQSGRQTALASAVGFVLQQLKLPKDEQKVLLIRDDPVNAEKWITAIGMAMPAAMAKRITFNTNINNLSSKTETRLFYAADSNARRAASAEIENQKKYPYFLIACYHPHDESSAAVRQFAASRYIILDGERKALDYSPVDIHRKYYRVVEEYNELLRVFSDNVITADDITSENIDIPELFDAYWYLTNTSIPWDYRNTVNSIYLVTDNGLPERKLSARILEACLSKYSQFAETDRQGNYLLLERMTRLAKQCGREGDVTACIADGIQKTLTRSGGTLFAANWASIRNSVLSELAQPVLSELLNDTELEMYCIKFSSRDPLSVETMLDMFFTMLSNQGNVAENFFISDIRVNFVLRGIMVLSDHEENLMRIVRSIKRYDKILNFLIFNVGAALLNSKPENANRWFNLMIDECGLSLFDICGGLCGIQGITTDRVEDYLRSRVTKTGVLDASIITAFNHTVKRIGKNDRTGIRLFEEGIRLAKAEDFNNIVMFVQQCSLSAQASEEIYSWMDHKLMFRCDSNEVSEKTFDSLKRWAVRLRKPCKSIMLRELFVITERTSNPKRAVAVLREFAENKITLPVGYCTSAPIKKMTDKIGTLYDGEVYITFMTMFDTSEQEKLVTTVVCQLMDQAVQANLPERQMIPLCSAAVLPYSIAASAQQRADQTKKLILEILELRMADYYRPNLEARIIKSRDCDRNVRDVLLKMIKNRKNGVKKSGIGGLFNIFR